MSLTSLPDGRYHDVNEMFLSNTGFARDEVIGRNSTELGLFLSPDDRVRLTSEASEKGSLPATPLSLRIKSGDIRESLVSICIISIRRQKYLLSSILDVTERKQAEDALRASEEKFRKAFQTSPDAMAIVRMSDETIVAVNDGYTRMSGYIEAETVGKTAREINIWKDPEDRRKFVEELQSKGLVHNYEATFVVRTGEIRGLMSGSIIELEGVPHILSVTRDITEQRRTEAALRESESDFRTIFENNSAAMAVIERNTTISMVNREYCRLGLYEEKEVIGLSWTKQVHPDDLEMLLAYNRKRLVDPASAPDHYEFRFLRKDGEVRHCLMSVATLPVSQKFICSFVDVTVRKQAEVRASMARGVLERLNQPLSGADPIRDILQIVKQGAEIEAVGIRLREGDDYPYYETSGFPEHFVEKERRLGAHDEEGRIQRDAQGHPVLECMCGRVIRGRPNPAQPSFTQGGSFWTNSTTELRASTTEEEDRQTGTRNHCNGEGYESVALIPLKSGEEIIGLLQLNDHRRNRFTLGMIEFFEWLGASIGIALARRRAAEDLQEQLDFSRSVLSTAQAVVLLLDTEGRIVEFNPYLEELSGYRLEEVKGQDWFSAFLPPDDRQPMRELFSRAITGIPTRGNVNPILTRDGRLRQIEWYDKAMRDAKGNVTGLLAMGQDVTERKRAGERIAQHLEELRRWQAVMLGREDRNMELKREVNDLLRRLGEPIRYPSQEEGK
jgi:PAS domain S-box-containing protein